MSDSHSKLQDRAFDPTRADAHFLSPAHRESLATLEYGFQAEPSGLMLLVGEAGTGKTALIRTLLSRQSVAIRAVVVANPTVSFEEMLRFIAQEIRIYPVGKDKLAILRALKTFLSDPEIRNRVVLIFDEAQELSDEILAELRLLSDFDTENGQSLQIVLVGQPELAERLEDPKLRALNQRIGVRARLCPLQGREIFDYVEHLFREDGRQIEIFSRGALKRLARLSRGLPRRLNIICQNSLRFASSEGSDVIKPQHVRAAAAIYDDAGAFSRNRLFHSSTGARLHWFSSESMRVVVGASVVITALLALFIFAGTGWVRPWLMWDESMGSTGPPSPGSPLQSDQPLENSLHAATFNPAIKNPSVHQLDSQKTVPSARPRAVLPDKKIAGPENGIMRSPVTMTGDLPPLVLIPVEEGTASSTSKSTLNSHTLALIKYDTKRAAADRRAGHYNSAIWRLERAIALDPDNQGLRGLLLGARSAKAASLASDPASLSPSDSSAETTANTVDAPATNASDNDNINTETHELDQGDAYMRKGDYDDALIKFKVARMMDPGNEEINDRIVNVEKAKAVEAETLP
jgi:type II secretory pathway predicted ATPase ExeA